MDLISTIAKRLKEDFPDVLLPEEIQQPPEEIQQPLIDQDDRRQNHYTTMPLRFYPSKKSLVIVLLLIPIVVFFFESSLYKWISTQDEHPILIPLPTPKLIVHPIALCDEEFVIGPTGDCWEERNGGKKTVIAGGYNYAYAIKLTGNTSIPNYVGFNSLAQWIRDLPEGSKVTIRIWFKDISDGQSTIHIRAHNGLDENSTDLPYRTPGKDWTLETLQYQVDAEQKMRLIIDIKGEAPILIGRVEAEWQ